jgi:hypothetical protein
MVHLIGETRESYSILPRMSAAIDIRVFYQR